MKRLSDFLDVFDSCSGLWCTIWYLGEEDEPLWTGSLRDIPYWAATCKLPTREEVRKQDWDEVISFRNSVDGNENKGKPGLVIVVKD